LGAVLPVLPGRHQVELRDASHRVLRTFVVALEAKERRAVATAPLPAPKAPPAVVNEPVPAPAAPQVTSTPRHAVRQRHRALLNAAYTSGGIALGTLTASLVFGALSLQAKNTVARHCEQRWCDATGYDAAQRGSRFVLLADVALVVGGVAGLTSAGLFWAYTRGSVGVTLTPGGGATLSYKSAF
jgi:hypothetical protein